MLQGQYNIASHTILPLIYRILGPSTHITYALKQPVTKSLILFNPLININLQPTHNATNSNSETQEKYYSWLVGHVGEIEKVSGGRLTHIVSNSGSGGLRDNYDRFMDKLAAQNRKDIKCIIPNKQKLSQLKPQVFGQISICLIGAQGYSSDYNLIGVTHISPTSTKMCSRVDYQYRQYEGGGDCDQAYLRTLDKVKYFPNETYIFPSHTVQQADLLFAKAILASDASNTRMTSFLQQKITTFNKTHKNSPDCLIPTTVLEEKLMNPFMQPERYGQLLGVKGKDRVKCFGLLRAMRGEWKGAP